MRVERGEGMKEIMGREEKGRDRSDKYDGLTHITLYQARMEFSYQ